MPAITEKDRKTLRFDGFTEWEIAKFDNATTPSGDFQNIDIRKDAWKDARKSRRAYVARLKAKGWSDKDIRNTIYKYYVDRPDTTPFDFLKYDYKPPRKLTDSEYDALNKVRKSLNKHMKGYGQKGMPTSKQKRKRRF